MLIHKFRLWLAAVAAVVGLATSASAGGSAVQHPQMVPFIEPDYFDPDLQFFAPADVDYFGDPAPLTTGWFFTYDRMYMGVSRPDTASRPWDLDMTWGNRFDIGYMTEDDGGWLFSGTHVDGPTGEADSAKASLTSVELNRVFRLQPTFHNGVIEPFIGLRFAKFTDYGYPTIAFGDTIENNIFAGQLGVRVWKNVGRWKLSSDVRFFGGVNYQMYTTEDFAEAVPGGEVRAEAQYNLTRDVALRCGYEMMYFGTGIARNNNLVDNTEDLVIHGLTFGFTINR
jgi:hypothetical protein